MSHHEDPPHHDDGPQHGGRGRIDSDAPTEFDELGRHQLLGALERIVVDRAQTPLVIAIYGAWGTGKTSLMKQLRRRLDPGHDGSSRDGSSPARTVWFDPWMHQFDDVPALGLLHSAVDQLGIGSSRNVTQALMKLAIAMGEDVQVPFVGVRVGKLLKVRDELAQSDFNRREERARLRAHFHDVLEETGATEDHRVVFFIDDLDRCQPRVALALLESLKLYLDFPGCVFVLGIDREPLEAAVAVEYSALGLRTESYLDKIIQLPLALPAIDHESMDSFVRARLPDDLQSCAAMLSAATADQPRNVKRMTNTLLINHELARDAAGFEDGYDPRILAMVVLIQNEAPALHRLLRTDPALITTVFAGRDPEPGGDPPTEQTLWTRHIAPKARLDRALRLVELPDGLDLSPYLTLTSLIPAPPDPEPSAPSVPSAATWTDVPGRAERGSDIDAWISYSRLDGEIAGPLREGLNSLGRRRFRRAGLLRVGLDATSLAAGSDLMESTRDRLAAADHLIVLLGPGAAASKWVDQEIRMWLAEHAADRLILVLVDGVLDWDPGSGRFSPEGSTALPPVLLDLYDVEPLWHDLRWAAEADPAWLSPEHPRFAEDLARIAGSILGVSPDEVEMMMAR